MHRIDGPAALPGGIFTDGDPTAGTPATVVTDDWANAVQEELAHVIEATGVTLAKPDNTQLLAAIRLLVDAAVPVGTVLHGYYATAPGGYLLCAGQTVSRAAFPRLWAYVQASGFVVTEAAWAAGQQGLYGEGNGSTTFRLPDLRAEFVRGADLGRGVSEALTVGARHADAIQNITGTLSISDHGASGVTDGAFARAASGGVDRVFSDHGADNSAFTFDASRVARTAFETRPRAVVLAGVVKV